MWIWSVWYVFGAIETSFSSSKISDYGKYKQFIDSCRFVIFYAKLSNIVQESSRDRKNYNKFYVERALDNYFAGKVTPFNCIKCKHHSQNWFNLQCRKKYFFGWEHLASVKKFQKYIIFPTYYFVSNWPFKTGYLTKKIESDSN